jgi:hypothetical protein
MAMNTVLMNFGFLVFGTVSATFPVALTLFSPAPPRSRLPVILLVGPAALVQASRTTWMPAPPCTMGPA